MVRPVATYACHVWWPIIDKKVYADALNKLNRLALLSITGAMKTTPTAALEVLLNVIPLDLHVKQSARITLNRLKQTDSLKTELVRHSEIIRNVTGGYITDYLTPYNVMEEELNTTFPSLDDWLTGNVKFSELNFYTDGSKIYDGTGCGVFCSELNLETFYRLRTDCSIFQAEI